MEKSIENIWKEGFKVDNNLLAPKVTNLYNKKSTHLVSKISRMLRCEVKVLIPLSIFILVFNVVIGNEFWTGIPAAIWCVAWYFIAKKQTEKMTYSDNSLSCFEYLKSFQKRVKKGFKFYEKILLTGTPLFLLPLIIYTYFNSIDKNLGEIFGIGDVTAPNALLFLLIPLFTVFSYLVFKIALWFGYGKVMAKLNALIKDMEALGAD